MNVNSSRVILDTIIGELYDTREISEVQFKKLYMLLGDTLLESLHMVESRSVTKIQSKSGRFVYRVSDLCLYPNEEKDEYERDVFACFIKPKRHCTCKYFFREVVTDETVLICRHVFAVILSDILNEFNLEIIEDIPFGEKIYNWERPDWA